jgi:hypothetical protein
VVGAEVERTLVRLAELASRARARMDELAKEIPQVREGIDKIRLAASAGSDRAQKGAKGAAESTSEDPGAQVEVVFK